MRRSSKLLWIAAAMVAIADASIATAQGPSGIGPWGSDKGPNVVYAIKADHLTALRDLRSKGLALTAADGGELTRDHREMLQEKLDSIQSRYARALHNAELY